MKKYYKFFILLIVISFIVPQIAFASWWNPFSWGIWNNIFHKADTKTQILENRVKELESKLNEQPILTPAVTETNNVANTEAAQQAAQQAATQAAAQAAQQAAQQVATQAAAQAAQQAAQQAAAAKQAELNAINLEIANLNAKYAQDIPACTRPGVSMSFVYGCENEVTRKYNVAYNALIAKFQQVKYGN